MTYYAQRKSILNGQPQSVVNKYGERRQMERQYHLFCANACDGEEFPFDLDAIEWGTLENGVIERKVYEKVTPEPEPEEPVEDPTAE
jgi:hypothetical protein